MSTITVERVSAKVIKMIWTNTVTEKDVNQSFKAVSDMLSDSPFPMFVIVDIRSNPAFPITATLTGALFGPYNNPNLREWLMVGSNTTARFIERTLTAATGRNLIHWFKDEVEANNYIMRNTQHAGVA